MTSTTGQTLQNRYRVVSLLGQGGMGAVYRAWDTRLEVPIALKEMVPQAGLSRQALAQLRQQFRQEAQVLARLKHPHLVRVGDFFEESGRAYLVMDFAEGESLAELIEREGALPEGQVLAWAHQLLTALGYCHEQGVIHRDVKPQNVIIRPDGQVVLVDFGLVKLWDPGDPQTKTAMRGMGTPEYSPPEQYDAEVGHTDPRSDIYSLGATLYHALTGQAPPTATMRMADPEQFVPVRAVAPGVSERTAAAIMKALELARSQRWQGAGEMAAALGAAGVAGSVPVPGGAVPAARPRGRTEAMAGAPPAARVKQKRRPVWAWALGGVAVVALVLVMGLVLVIGEGGGRSTPMPGAEDTSASAIPGGVEGLSTSLPSPSAPLATLQQGLPSVPASTSTPMAGWTPTPKPPLPSPTPWALPSPTPSPLPPPATSVPPTATPLPPAPTPVPPPPPPPPTAPPSQPTWTPPPP